MALKRLFKKTLYGGGSLIKGHIADALLKKKETGRSFRECLQESINETFQEDLPGTSHIYQAGKAKGVKEGISIQARLDEEKFRKQAQTHDQDRDKWNNQKQAYEDLLDGIENNEKINMTYNSNNSKMRLIGFYTKINQTMKAEKYAVSEAEGLAALLHKSFLSLIHNPKVDENFRSSLTGKAVFILKNEEGHLFAYSPSMKIARINGVKYTKPDVIPVPLEYKGWFFPGDFIPLIKTDNSNLKNETTKISTPFPTDYIKQLILDWNSQVCNGDRYGVNRSSITKAISIAQQECGRTQAEIIAFLCALNLLNAAIKIPAYKHCTNYGFIKGQATKTIDMIDQLEESSFSYYYNEEERCLYFDINSIIFSFHEVPSTPSVQRAAIQPEIRWSGIRLQKIALPLFKTILNMI
ncbi:MAG: hypothetical protein HDS26_04560 [Bacteroides sp.]|nr:hypothetical protein [Bacteroides sp.]